MSGAQREFLLDVSRLIWRGWRRSLPTGIDRVCLEYVGHFGARSQAVVQRSGATFVLSPAHSDRLFELIAKAQSTPRSALVAVLIKALTEMRRKPPAPDMTYLNVGHTGLDAPALPAWIGRNRVKAVFLVHDMIPLTHPEYCRAGEADKHQRRIQHAIASAAGIIANSQATLDELATFAGARGVRLPPSTVAWISGPRLIEDAADKRLERPHFVALGTIEGRKNHMLLLSIWQRLAAKLGADAPRLVIIGQRGWQAEPVFALLDGADELRGSVIEFNACSDADAAAWLRGARALLMPSFAEGFGLPVIEAFQLGTPVIASDLPVYREIVGDLPTYLDPNDADGWMEAVSSFSAFATPERDRQLSAMGNFRAPDWPTHFAKVERWLQTL